MTTPDTTLHRELAARRGESELMRAVRSFHAATGSPVAGGTASFEESVIPRERLLLRMNLIAEEFAELVEAVMGPAADSIVKDAWKRALAAWDENHIPDVVEAADALGDIAYVVAGTAIEAAIPLDAVITEIHRANMSKLDAHGNPVLRADGKVLRSDLYTPPDVAAVLATTPVSPPVTATDLADAWSGMAERATDERDSLRVLAADLGLVCESIDLEFAGDVAFASPRARQDTEHLLSRMLHIRFASDADDLAASSEWDHTHPVRRAVAQSFAAEDLATVSDRELERAWRAAAIAAASSDEDPVMLAARVLGAHVV